MNEKIKRPSDYDYDKITDMERLSVNFIDAFYWNEDVIQSFDILSKIIKEIEQYLTPYNLTIQDLLTRNEVQERIDLHNKLNKECLERLNSFKQPIYNDDIVQPPYDEIIDEMYNEIISTRDFVNKKFRMQKLESVIINYKLLKTTIKKKIK